MRSILKSTMFYNSTYGPGTIIEIMWKFSSRMPVMTISRVVFGCKSSEIFSWTRFFREVAGYFEDKNIIKLGGEGRTVEADGMFVIGKRKGGVGRWHTKEHVFAITERGSRKIRRIVVKDKTAAVLSVFDKHIKPGTVLMTDPGMENSHFKDLESVVEMHEIPGPIQCPQCTLCTQCSQFTRAVHPGYTVLPVSRCVQCF